MDYTPKGDAVKVISKPFTTKYARDTKDIKKSFVSLVSFVVELFYSVAQ